MATLTIQPDEAASNDTYIDEDDPTAAGSAAQLYIGKVTGKGSMMTRSLIEFDISSLPAGSYISDATITFTVNSAAAVASGGQDGTAYRTVQNIWDETASWNYSSGSTKWIDAEGAAQSYPTYTTFPATLAFNVTGLSTTVSMTGTSLVTLLRDARNFRGDKLSLMLRMDDEAEAGYIRLQSANNATESYRPMLEITYYSTATIQWTGGAGDNSLDTAGNWSGGSVPGQYDTVQFSSDTPAATSGTLTCSKLHISKEYGSDLGTSSTALSINCEKAVMERENGRTNINFNPSSGSTDQVFIMRVPGANGYTTLGGSITNLYVSEARAFLKIRDSATIGTVFAAPEFTGGVAIEFGASVNCDLYAMRGSRIKSASGLDDITLTGRSDLEITTEAGDTASGETVISKSTLKHNGSTTSGGKLTIYSGTYDLTSSTVSQHTLANLDTFGGILDARTGLNSFNGSTVAGTWNYYGGRILVDPGTTLDI